MSNSDILMRPFEMDDLLHVCGTSPLHGQEVMLANKRTIFTFTYKGAPIACAGMVLLWPGVAEAWTTLSDWAKHHPIWLVKTLRRELKVQMINMELRRAQMHVEDTPELCRWARAMGFQYEGTLRKYTPDGKTLHVYALLSE